MKAKLKNLIRDLIIGRDAPAGPFKNKQINDFFVRARELMPRAEHTRLTIEESNTDGLTVRELVFYSINLGVTIQVTIHSRGDDHQFPVLNYDFLEDFVRE